MDSSRYLLHRKHQNLPLFFTRWIYFDVSLAQLMGGHLLDNDLRRLLSSSIFLHGFFELVFSTFLEVTAVHTLVSVGMERH